MASGKERAIYVPSTDTVYPSIGAASKALGVDASNIGKVLRGSRTSAGGYIFIEVPKNASQKTIADVREAAIESIGPQKRERLQKTQEKYIDRLSPKAREKREKVQEEETRKKKEAASDLHTKLVEVNRILKQYKKRKLDAYSGIIPELEQLKAIIGSNKQGNFDTSIKKLKEKFSAGELRALLQRVTDETNRKGFKNLDAQEKKRANVAYQMGTSSQQLEKYRDVLPQIWNVLEMSREQNGRGTDPPVYSVLRDAISADVDPEEIAAIAEEFVEMYERMAEDLANAEEDPAQYDVDAIRDYYDTWRDDIVAKLEDITDVNIAEEQEEDYEPEWWRDIT